MPCSVPCDALPCPERCDKTLDCGHRCPSLCSEVCPHAKFCQTCCEDDVRNIQADYITLESYGEIDLDTDPIIVPSCGHLITVSSLDGFMDMTKYYTFGEGNTITAVVNASIAFSAEKDMKICPSCRASLRDIQRYSRIIRRAVLDESSKRFIVWSSHDYLQLEVDFVRVQEIFLDATIEVSVQNSVELKDSSLSQFNSINHCQMFSKWGSAVTLYIIPLLPYNFTSQFLQVFNDIHQNVSPLYTVFIPASTVYTILRIPHTTRYIKEHGRARTGAGRPQRKRKRPCRRPSRRPRLDTVLEICRWLLPLVLRHHSRWYWTWLLLVGDERRTCRRGA